jgi:mannose-6-phosphate isomerase-like protein (cupin superfamily)
MIDLMKIQPIKHVEKKWGYEDWLTNSPGYCTKVLGLKKGLRCSLHSHETKDETFYIVLGRVLIEKELDIIREAILLPGDAVRIMPRTKHRFSGLEDSLIIEASTHHEDSDSYRVEGQLSGKVPEEIMEKYKK